MPLIVSSHKELNVAKLPPVVAVRSLLPRSWPKYYAGSGCIVHMV